MNDQDGIRSVTAQHIVAHSMGPQKLAALTGLYQVGFAQGVVSELSIASVHTTLWVSGGGDML